MRVSKTTQSPEIQWLTITISFADLIIVLRDGQVVEQGTHTDLLAIEGGVYQDLWNAQLHDNTSTHGNGGEAATV